MTSNQLLSHNTIDKNANSHIKSYDLINISIKPFFLQVFWIILAAIPFLILTELIIRIPGLDDNLPPPSPSISFPYTEYEIKFKRYFKNSSSNCLLIGSSVVNTDVDPVILEEKINPNLTRPLSCLNLGLSGSVFEVTESILKTLVTWNKPEIVFIGVSPYDFDGNFIKTRPLTKIPTFSYNNGNPTFIGWLFNRFRFPWYFVSLSNQSNPIYREQVFFWENLVDSKGMRRSYDIGEIVIRSWSVKHREYSANPVDLAAFDALLDYLHSENIDIVVFEIPTNSKYIPFYLRGGEGVYKRTFLEPVTKILEKYDIEMIYTEHDLLSPENLNNWHDQTHLNAFGAEEFTIYLTDKIDERQLWEEWK